MAASNPTQTSFLGGRFSPASQGRYELPEYAAALAECQNFIPVEEGSLVRRSGTRDLGVVPDDGQIKEFWLDNNIAAVLELTPRLLRIWAQDTILNYAVEGTTFTAPYTTVAQCKAVQIKQADNQAYFILDGQSTWVLSFQAGVWNFKQGTWHTCDGPYISPFGGNSQTNNSLGSVSDGSRTPTFTITDGAYSFVGTDFNRTIRLWSQPPAWSKLTAYDVGDAVTYTGVFWQCLIANTNVAPGQNTTPATGSGAVATQAWAINPNLGQWSWGFISAVIDDANATVNLLSSNNVPFSVNGGVIDTWQLGLYTDSPGGAWPSAGCYHQGRLFLSSVVGGQVRVDACVSDGIAANGTADDGILNPPLFGLTDQFGNVLDASGITAVFNISPVSRLLWMEPYMSGIVCGTAHFELYINASVMGDPITPTTFQVNQQSLYKAASVEPMRLGLAIAFIQSFSRRLMEYVVDVFSQKFVGRHLNIYAKDLTSSGIVKICYQEELAPILWAVMNDGTLAGCTYRRLSQFGQTAPEFMAWHTHKIGSGRTVKWACIGTDFSGRQDVLMLLTFDGKAYHLEVMEPLFEGGDFSSAWFLDSAISSSSLTFTETDTGFIIGGVPGPENKLFNLSIAGLSCGAFPCHINTLTVPWGSDPDGLLTAAYLKAANLNAPTYMRVLCTIDGVNVELPLVVGTAMTSTMTLLRPQNANELRTPSGPGLGKTRRGHMYGVHLAQSSTGASVSIDGGPTAEMRLVGRDQQTPLTRDQLFDGVHWDTIDADYSFDGQLTISRNDALPMTICATTVFTRTQER